ncbi:MAG: hypothetical protein QNJ97_16810 [Myxococcota bacterium]|nr:hypothetical protein [Myxococcota bacterium]
MTTSQTNNPVKQRRSGPSVMLIIAVVLLAAIALWIAREGGDASSDISGSISDFLGLADVTEAFQEKINGKGKMLAIGPSALKIKAPGTEIIGVDQVDKLADLLQGTDVDAVTTALKDAGISCVLVDPSIAKRNPLPKTTVTNRLALARPAGRFSAKLMSKKLFYYEIGDPPLELSIDAKRTLTSIARDAFGGGPGFVPPNTPDVVKKRGKWTGILTVRPLQSRHISYHTVTTSTLADTAKKLGQKARRYYNKRSSLIEQHGQLEQALAQKITIELEILYDWGTFIGPRDRIFLWRIIEPGIYGIRMAAGKRRHYVPPWYSITNNYRLVSGLFERITKKLKLKDEDRWQDADVPFDRFRTVHWRERAPSGDIEDLYRASPHVPKMTEVNRETMIASLKGLGDWIADNQTHPNGRYVYRYFPTKDEENEEYNMVRHCLGPFSMALVHEFAPDPKLREKAEAGMRFIENHIRWGGPPRHGNGEIDNSATSWMGKPLPGPDVAIIEFEAPQSGDWSAKMGSAAVSILGYTQYKRAGWQLSPEREKVLTGLANFLLYMQDDEAGNFHHYYVGTQSHFYGTRNSIYPGEILYAVARLYGETKEERYRVAFKKSFKANLEWFKDQMAKRLSDGTYEEKHRKNLVQFQPWMAMALDEMYRYDPDPAYVEASNLVSLWILDTFQFDETRAFFPDYLGGYMKVLDELPAMHTFVYTEGTAASFDLARRAGAEPHIIDRLRKGALTSARFILQQQVRLGENDYYYPNPKKAKGGVRYCMNHNKQRIDYTYHALSSVYRILRAATDADYAAVQSLPTPNPH